MTDIRPNNCYKCGALGHIARSCPNINSSRTACFNCHQEGHLAQDCPQKLLNHPRYKPGDWVCLRCRNVNFARRAFCNNCGAAKPTATGAEERVGFGGGFRESGDVEYKKHNSEDDELDDFGRTKKAFRGRQLATTTIVGAKSDSAPPADAAVPDDDDDDDDDGGKYDAWGSESDGEKAPKSRSPEARRRSRSRSRSPKRK